MINHYKRFDGYQGINFYQVWNEVVPEPNTKDLKRASELEKLFKYHSTFMAFARANELTY